MNSLTSSLLKPAKEWCAIVGWTANRNPTATRTRSARLFTNFISSTSLNCTSSNPFGQNSLKS